MNQHSYNENTQNYFDRVMNERHSPVSKQHPYQQNFSWQKHYSALRRWISSLSLENGHVLEVGCGSGLLQDLVPRYYGIDIAFSAGHYMHKPFCVSSGRRLPFPNNYFDGAWSIWVLEHVEEPQEMLDEMRRVVRPGGSIFLVAAYGVDSWISRGIHKRLLRDLSLSEILIRVTIPVRRKSVYKAVTTFPKRINALVSYLRQRRPTQLSYKQLQPSYDIYWDYDADACVALDAFDVALYFLSRGDQPLLTGGIAKSLFLRSQPQAYMLVKE
jgi:ubiquinone/menaquinone biosynthesis C-methylase UbiE